MTQNEEELKPLKDIKLPCEVRIGHTNFGAGVSVRTLVLAARSRHDFAQQMLTERTALRKENERLREALSKVIAVCHKDGIHQWHEESKGDFTHGGGDQITHKADYYVNANWLFRMANIAKQALKESGGE